MKLQKYADALIEDNFDTLERLACASDEDLVRLQVKFGHRRHLLLWAQQGGTASTGRSLSSRPPSGVSAAASAAAFTAAPADALSGSGRGRILKKKSTHSEPGWMHVTGKKRHQIVGGERAEEGLWIHPLHSFVATLGQSPHDD